jgi:glucose-6-phosphate isomerase
MTTAHPSVLPCDQTPAWAELQTLHARGFDLRAAFASNPQRFAQFSLAAPYVLADLSKNLLDADIAQALNRLAEQTGLQAQRAAMFRGELVNRSEGRAVMHWLLRKPDQALANADGAATEFVAKESAEVLQTRHAMLAYAESIRQDQHITDVVNIGIGGSDLGPQMAYLALKNQATRKIRFHFVSSVDGTEMSQVFTQIKPETTLFLVASKSFTTLETMTNAHTAKAWFLAQGGRDVARHFCALTTNIQAAAEFGISTTFGFKDWVGGRYSMWSAIGLPIAIAVGTANFMNMLAGAHAMDEHFLHEPLATNVPVQLALLDIWYRNFHDFRSRSVAPYHSGLRRLQAYLQQLEMESNGKQVDQLGQPLHVATSPVIWGEPAANGQHAYFQMLHQGSDVIPVEFIVVKAPNHGLADHHTKLLANALAQSRALMLGQEDAGGHRHLPGNRPSTTLLLDELTPQSLGALVALQEHRVFASGAMWGINSFDQWGVELGKVIAKDMEQRLHTGSTEGLDSSTAALLLKLRD